MATLQKFKLLATQCTISTSPTRSPSASPVIHLRRRKTLRMLLSRHRQTPAQPVRHNPSHHPSKSPERRNPVAVSLKLKDFLMSSPSPERVSERVGSFREQVIVPRGGGRGNLRPFTATLRQRLLKKSFRPVLVGIPE